MKGDMDGSKRAYEEMLNDIPVPWDEKRSQGGRIPDRATKYGSWIRQNDPIAFQVGWQEWVREQEYLMGRQQRSSS